MFSEKGDKTVNACRFCWMCRHICPVGLATGKESNTPRAKALMISMTEKGIDLKQDMMEDMYECCLCNACAHDCQSGYEPAVFIREARTCAVANGLLPAKAQPVVDRLLADGNLFGESPESKFDALGDSIAGLPETAPVLVYIGETAARRAPRIAKAFLNLLRKAGVEFTVRKDEAPCGAESYDLIGLVSEVQDEAKACAAQIAASGARTVIVLDPACARVMKQEYPVWGCQLQAEVVTATVFVAQLLREGRLHPQKKELGPVTFQDPCRLARDLEETEPAREILRAMGADLREMFLHGQMTKCCGNEILNSHSPHLAERTAKARAADAKRTGAKLLVTACPGCRDILEKGADEALAVEDLFVLLDRCC
ncbi:(Fe-S)-binding protein [Anaerotruncus rubiinfantis]|uniref:(Fe-S)-binding protein n=1 Tax=Anaerotruncus rubiinfantis TaxID=1720200 RepID=UPI00082B9AFB|nr:(Fe-S)-binding protein [Anaerotruncus rubiinfantis]